VPVLEEPDGIARYRPCTEGLFAQILRCRDPASSNDYWEVHSKDGLVSRYGFPGRAGTDGAVVAHPPRRDRAFAWKLSETRDPFGSRIEYEYLRTAARMMVGISSTSSRSGTSITRMLTARLGFW
jgi:hypothetical protein